MIQSWLGEGSKDRDARELTLRVDSRRYGLKAEVEPVHDCQPFGMAEIILFVHGYNSKPEGARKCYNTFQNSMDALNVLGVFNRWVWRLYWPGSTWFYPRSVLSYGKALKRAKESAPKLANYIVRTTSKGGPAHWVFVAHSMGCRLVCETVRELANRPSVPGLRSVSLCLMAGAVPEEMLISGGRLRAAVEGTRWRICLYSSQEDWILRFFFPFGQIKAEETTSEAVGLFGEPSELWSRGIGDQLLGHTEYWSSRKPPAELANQMMFSADCNLEENRLPVWEPVPLHELGRRTVGDG